MPVGYMDVAISAQSEPYLCELMLEWGASIAAVAFAYACEHPVLLAELGVKAKLSGKRWSNSLYRAIYTVLTSCYALIHRKQPDKFVDQLAQFLWNENQRDAEQLAQIQNVLDKIVSLQNKPVHPGDYQPELADMREQVMGKDFKGWHDLGFQGETPATDFRGAGSFGLIQFHSFCTNNTKDCQRLVSESRSATSQDEVGPWYPLALVSIRLSMALCELLKREKVLVFGLYYTDPQVWLRTLETVHAALLVQFHEAWLQGVNSGSVKTYFDCEFVLKDLEKQLPVHVYTILMSLPQQHEQQ